MTRSASGVGLLLSTQQWAAGAVTEQWCDSRHGSSPPIRSRPDAAVTCDPAVTSVTCDLINLLWKSYAPSITACFDGMIRFGGKFTIQVWQNRVRNATKKNKEWH